MTDKVASMHHRNATNIVGVQAPQFIKSPFTQTAMSQSQERSTGGLTKGMINHFKANYQSSGLPPLLNRRSAVMNDNNSNTRLEQQKQTRQAVGASLPNSLGSTSFQRRFDMVNPVLKKSYATSNNTSTERTQSVDYTKLIPGLSHKAASLLEQATTNYQTEKSSRSQRFRLSRQEHYQDRMTREANQIAKVKLAVAKGYSSHDMMNEQDYNSYQDQEIIENGNGQVVTRAERKKGYKMKVEYLHDKKQRQWLIKHGKGHVLAFKDHQITKLKECFGSLDADGSGAIGVEELEDPLIGLGFAETRQEVQDMIDAVDDDKSGMIEFSEFLQIIKGSNTTDKTAKINKFFKDMTSGKLASEGISFNMFVHRMRRDYLKDAIMGDDQTKQEFGQKILQNVAKQFSLHNMGKSNIQSSFMFSQKINSQKTINNNNQGEEGEVIIDQQE